MEKTIGSDDILDLYGVGSSLEEARQDYWLALQDYYNDLTSNVEYLADHFQEHLKYLRSVLAQAEEAD